MKRVLCLSFIAVAVISISAFAFDTESYCKKVGNGSYQIEELCLKQEKKAEKELSKITIPSQVEEYCKKVAGDSYQIMLLCVRQELKSKKRLEK